MDVMGGTPREGHIVNPCTRVIPATYIHTHIVAACVLDGLTDGGVALLRVKGKVLSVLWRITTAEVYLDEVETALLEIEISVVLVVVVESHIHTQLVAIIHITAGIGPGIAVDASLEVFGVDIFDHGFQSVGEAGGVNEQLSCRLVATAKEAIVYVDVIEAYILQSFRHHGISLTAYQCVADVDAIRIPRTPAHCRAILCGQIAK